MIGVLEKTLEHYNMTIVFRSVFHEGNKYPQVFLDECVYTLSTSHAE